MRVTWTVDAANDLFRIVEHIREDNHSAALRIARVIFQGVATLRSMPQRGRVGRAPDTRELVFAPLPYIAVYEVFENRVQVLRIRHSSQDWP